MKVIKDKMNELIEVCESRVQKVEQERAENNAAAAENKRLADELSAREKNVAADEQRLGKKKLIVQTINEANAYLVEARDKTKKIREDRDAFEDEKKAHAAKVADDMAEVQRQKDKVAKEAKELEEKSKTYKKEVMDAIIKESNKG